MRYSSTAPVKIVVIGAGGTGGYVIPHLYRLGYASHRDVRVIVCDGDVVEEKNLIRQNFVEQDIGRNKAQVQAERYSAAFGIECEYKPDFIENDVELFRLTSPDFTARPYSGVPETQKVILLGCVDNNKSRQMCHRVFNKQKDLIYIDSGNGEHTGQVVCGVRQNGKTTYKPIGSLYPDVLKEEDKFPSELSCAERTVSAPQSVTANLTAATAISIDQFHSDADPKALSEYRQLPYYSSEKEKGFLPKGKILLEGRAAENNLGRFSKPFTEHIYDFDMHGWYLHIGDRIYINALGDVLLDPDLSYLNQMNENIGNIWEMPLDEILRESCYKLPEQYLPENNQKYVYCVHISAEANTITIEPNESRVYYSSPRKAVAAYQSVLNNLRITPVYSKDGRIPDDLDMKFGELPEIEDRCAGTEIRYLLPGATPKTVIVEVIRCPIEEDFDDRTFQQCESDAPCKHDEAFRHPP